MSILTFIYVGLTGVYVYISHKTLKEIKQQADRAIKEAEARDRQFADQLKVSRDAADAALRGVQTAINAERAWIIVNAEATGELPRKGHLYFRARNWGRTPAEVTRYSVTQVPMNRDDEAFPPDPQYQQTELTYTKYVIPKESFRVEDYSLGFEMTDDMWETMNKRNQRLTFIGHVVYLDLISRNEHETRFCYFLSPQPGIGLVMTGPRNYNQHT